MNKSSPNAKQQPEPAAPEKHTVSTSQGPIEVSQTQLKKSNLKLQAKPVTFQPFKELDEWQNKALEGLIRLFPESEKAPKSRAEMVNIAGKVFVEREATQSNASAQDQDQFQIYMEQCKVKDLIKTSAADAGERPEIFQKKILGTTSKYDLHKDYSMKFREELNKHTKDEFETVMQTLKGLLYTAQEEPSIGPAGLLDIFEILIIELFDKACMEPKFVEMYARIICALSQGKFYTAPLSKRKGHDLFQFQKRLTEAYKEKNPGFKHGFNVAEIIKERLTRKEISDEIQKGASQLEKYRPREKETDRERKIREENLVVHLRGCISFCGQLYLQGTGLSPVLISDFVFARLLVFILRVQGDEIARCLNYDAKKCEEIHKLNDDARLSEEVKKLIAAATEQRLQLDVHYIANMVQMLEAVYPKLSEHVTKKLADKNTSEKERGQYAETKKTLDMIKDCLLSFNEVIIPSHILFKLQEKVFRGARPQAQRQQQQSPPRSLVGQDYGQASFDAIEEELTETSLVGVLRKMLRAAEVTIKALDAEPRVLEFFVHVLRKNKHQQLLIRQVQMFLRGYSPAERAGFVSNFIMDFYHLLHEPGVNREAYWSVFKFAASQFHSELKLYDFTSQLPTEGFKSQFFITQIVKATVQNSFEQTLADQYENLLPPAAVAEAKRLIAEHKYYELTQMPALRQHFCAERSGYFGEADAAEFFDELVTPFDEEALSSFKHLFQTSLSPAEMRSKLSELCKHFAGDKAATKLYNLFQEIGFQCGFQALSIIKPSQENFDTHRKMRGFLLEYTIRQFSETKQDGLLRSYVGQYKQISLCLLEKAMAYLKDRPSEFVDILRLCEGRFDKETMKANIKKKADEQKSWGLLKEVVEYGRRL